LKDSYNRLEEYDNKSFDGSHANSLIEMFKKRFKNENDFYYDFDIDVIIVWLAFFGVTSRC